MNSLNKVLILGATSGIAEQVARQLVATGASLVCVARSGDKLAALQQDLQVRAASTQALHTLEADLADTDQHPELLQQAIALLGGLDAILIAHGSLPDQDQCQASFAHTQREMQVNGMSVISLLTEAGNYFEQQQRGVIAAISSVAGDRGRQSNYVYGAAKGMVSVFMQGLRNRLAKSNVSVVNIKPGFVATPMTAHLDQSGPLWAQPEQVASGIISAMQKGKDDVYLLWFWRWIMLIITHIPEAIFKRLSL